MDQLSRRLHQIGRGIERFPGFSLPGSRGELVDLYPHGMRTCRTVQRLRPDTAAYIAGIVDGEGTITLSSLHRGEHRRLVVSISNTDRSLLEFVRGAVGAGLITCKRSYKPHHAPGFTYKVTGRQALDLLSQIAGYLVTYRADRAQLAIQRYVALTPRNGKYRPEALRMRQEFEREFLALGPGPRSLAGR